METSKIFEGWKNKLLPAENMREVIKQTSEERLKICGDCPFHSKNSKTIRPDAHCLSCGCTLSAKTACLSCSCPEGKWGPVLKDTEFKEFYEWENSQKE